MPAYIGATALNAFIQAVCDKYIQIQGHRQVEEEINRINFAADNTPSASMISYMQTRYPTNYTSLKYLPDEVVKYINKCRVTNFSNAFGGCENLVDVPYMDTSFATDLSSMFYGCTRLKGEFPWPISLASLQEGEQNPWRFTVGMFRDTGITTVSFVDVPDSYYDAVHPTIIGYDYSLKNVYVDGVLLYGEP